MKDLLLLVHRIPFPPNKGDKIRSYHLLRYLNQHYRVHLGTYIDDPNDEQYIPEVEKMCTTSHFIRLKPKVATIKSLCGFLLNTPLSLPYYWSKSLESYVESTVEEYEVDRVVVFSSAVAQFANIPALKDANVVIDFVDIDSDKWRQYSENKPWPMSWVYHREYKKLEAWERKVATWSSASVFVSSDEAELFKKIIPSVKDKVSYFENGVDTDYFSPNQEVVNPYVDHDAPVYVFTGAMDYWANVDAVVWFAEKVFPLIQQDAANALFYIVGIRPSAKVLELAKKPGVVVTGAVPDVRPYVKHAIAAVAPLRIARGVQNKVLEALAMAKPVVATPQAVEGITFDTTYSPLVGESPQEVADLATGLINHEDLAGLGQHGRDFVLQKYNWEKNLSRIQACLEAASE